MFRISALFLIIGLIACSPAEQPKEEVTQTAAEPESNNPPELARYNEYLWCKQGENFSQESLSASTKAWLAATDNAGIANFGVYNLAPKFSDPNFDRIMLITWPDKETRDSGWETYLAQNIQASLDEQFPDVEQCGGDNWENVYGFAAYKTRDASVAWDRENTEAMVSYRFCSYQENKEPEDLRQLVQGEFEAWLTKYEETYGASSYDFAYLAPDFDDEAVERNEGVPLAFDYAWMDFWGNAAEAETGYSAWTETGFQTDFDAVALCSEPQAYDLTEIRPMQPEA